jgi:excinuclease ABC subunit C
VAWKDGYRRYRLRSVVGTDDFASIAEVMGRRFRDGPKREPLPDLLVIDGGAGQLAAARAALEPLGLGELPVIGLAKERVERDATAREVARRPERLFVPNRKNPIVLRTNSSALFLLQRARDEAHRFANAYHRKLRDRARLRSPLDDVPGIGPRRRRELLRHFGSVKRLRAATREELLAVPGISTEMATRIKENLR